MTDNDIVLQALRYLAGNCDYAQSQDRVGFNKFDTAYGHELALLPSLSPTQAASALKMLHKYATQLHGAGITLPDSIQAPNGRVHIGINDKRIMIQFVAKPSQEIRERIKSVPAWKWHPDLPAMPWSVPANPRNAKFIVVLIPEAEYSDEFTKLRNKPDNAPPPPPFVETVIRTNGDDLEVLFPVADGRKQRCEQLKLATNDEAKWHPELADTPWLVPVRFLPRLIQTFPDATVSDEARSLADKQRELAILSNRSSSNFEIPDLKMTLFPFQKASVEFLDKAQGRALIGHEMGLGKTVISLAWLQLHQDYRPAIIVCPASLKQNWKREISRWMSTDDRIHIVEGKTPYSLVASGASIVIINWDLLTFWEKEIVQFNPQVMIYDEAHYSKSGTKSLRGKAALSLSKKIKYLIELTGTPLVNRPIELYPLLHMINPKAWPSRFNFAKHFCAAYNNGFGWDFSGASNVNELHEVIKPYTTRVLKKQVLAELPDKRRENIVIEIEGKALETYESVLAEAKKKLASIDNRAEQLVMIEKCKQATVLGKLPGCIEWIENFLDTGEKLVVMATHHSTINVLSEHFKTLCVTLTGETPQDKRQDIVDKFQSDPSCQLFIGNIQAAGIGLTLHAASNVAFVEFAWQPGIMSQAEDRVHRIGQSQAVTVWHFIAADTIDEDIVSLLESKREIVDMVHDGENTSEHFGVLDELVKRIVSK